MDINSIADKFLFFVGVLVILAIATTVLIFRSGKETKV
jgi:hypothetical protein